MSGPILLAAGGTGGHLFPARALAQELRSRGRDLALITDRRGGDYSRLFDNMPIYRVRSGSPSRGGILGKVGAALQMLAGIVEAWIIERRLSPAAVVGFGGYPSLPGVVAAMIVRRPRILHEQNAVLGRVNRVLAPWVQAIALSFAETGGVRDRSGRLLRDVGNPVRQEIADVGLRGYRAPDDGAIELLVFGGSQGAAAFARVLPKALALLPESIRRRLHVTQQCRPEDLDTVTAAYKDMDIEARCATFFDDMPQLLSAAHLVVARAGAGTVSELAAVGRPSLLVPYPYAMDDHQSVNAQALAGAGGAWAVQEPDFTPEQAGKMLADLFANPHKLAAAAEAARSVSRPDAAARLADLVEEVAL